MPRPIRVLLEPRPVPGSADLPLLVRGCTVGLQAWSAGSSLAQISAPTAAELKFQARCLEDALSTSPLRTVDLGSVTGTVTLSPTGAPLFSIESAPTPPNEPTATSASHVSFQRSIELDFREADFAGVPDEPVTLLLADADLEGVRHVELTVSLDVGGAEEAALDHDDVLDIPLKLEFLALNVVDEVGEPLASQSIALAYDPATAQLTTDGDGQVRVQNPPGGSAGFLEFPAADAVRNELRQRWSKARNKPRLRPNRAVAVVSVTETLDEELSVDPGVRTVSLQPRVELVRFVGLFFETSKAFLLPSARAHLGKLQELYDAHPTSTLLIVGHADRAGSTSYNDKLSLERADAVAAYLQDDTSGFTKFYDASIAKEKRWGDREDRLMLQALDDGADLFATGDPVQAFRSSRQIQETGPTGPKTRDALVAEYMTDDAVLPSTIELVTHGCGENFPEVPTADGVPEEENRRVELFFFSTGFGVQPAPPGKNSPPNSSAYPEWRRRAQQTSEFDLRLGETRLLRMRLLDSDHEPLADMDVTVLHDFGSESSQTDSRGSFSVRIPARVESAVLVHDLGSVDLSLDALPPADDPLGIQVRLTNLGYECPTDGNLGPETADALAEFQSDQELDPTGTPDPTTTAKLAEVYGQ
jgi:outer membrane protein OmpA-like peptidoglycan-associated protein